MTPSLSVAKPIGRILGTLAGIVLSTLAFATPASAQDGPSVFINEIHYDNAGTDAGEFIEIAGPAGTDLSGYAIELYNGSGGARYDVDLLSGVIPDQQNGFGTVSLTYPSNGIQNGSPDGIALINGSTVIQFLSYEGPFTATSDTANGMVSTDIGVTEGGSDAIGSSLQLRGTGTTYGDFTWSGPLDDSPGAVNADQTFSGDQPSSITINDVQLLEGDSETRGATFTVTRSGNTEPEVTFNITTQDGTATVADNDYVPQSLVSQTIPSGGTSYTFTVFVNGDTTSELDETFTVQLSEVVGAIVVRSTGTGTIRNDEFVTSLLINEVDSDTPSTDVAEFVELYDGGTGNTPLDGLVVVLFNGSNDQSYAAFDLDGRSTDANGYFVLGNSAIPGVDFIFNNNLLQNGPDAVALFRGNASDFPNGTPVTVANLVDAVVYDTDDADDPGLLVLLNPGESQVNENAGGQGTSNSIQRCPNGSGGARDTSAYTARTPSPDGLNNCPAPPPPAVARAIHEIQSEGSASPFDGTNVITSGIVTLLKSNGFFLQVPDNAVDTNPNTSEGIFVFTSVAPAVLAGDAATVTGEVDEFFTLTQVRAQAGGVTVTSTGNALPAPVPFTVTNPNPLGAFDQLEKFEGMRIHADALTSVSPTEFGETHVVVQGVARPFREPGIPPTDPPLPAGAPCCIPLFDFNPEKFMVDTDGRLGSIGINVTSGVTFSGVTGPLDFTFGAYKIVTETDPSVTPNASASPVPVPTAQEFTIAAANLENFGITGSNFAIKLSKASLAIRNVANSPDIIGMVEILDIETLTALAEKINADTVAAGQGDPEYGAFLLEGSDEFSNDIDVGFLVKTSRVQVGSVIQRGKGLTFIDPTTGSPATLFERPPLVLRATIQRPNASAFPVTVIVNHPQSLIDVADPIRGPRQRLKRQLQAEFTANLAQEFQAENLVMVGDFNAYQFNDGYVDVIGTILGSPTPSTQVLLASPDLVNPDLTDLVEALPADQRYSFVFEGNAQMLDHVLVDQDMLARLSRFSYGRVNADFPEFLFSLDPTRPERVSDHDIPVAYFTFPAPQADLQLTKTAASSTVVSGGPLSYSLVVKNNGPDGASSVAMTDTTPANTTFGSLTSAPDWTCSTPAVNSTGEIRCTTSSFAADATATFALTVNVNCETADGTSISNTATVGSSTNDSDSSNNSSTVAVTVSNPAPGIGGVSVDQPSIGPPNHKMVDVAVAYTMTDNCGPVTSVLTVSSNQPINGTGDGDTEPDWEVVGPHHLRLRAERAGNQDRIYTITITATDSAGNSSTATATVTVPGNRP